MNNDYDALFDSAGKYFNVDPQLGKTVFQLESSGNVNAPRGTSGEIGGMQFMPGTASRLNMSDPKDMSQAIPAAMRLLREGLDKTGSAAGALAYYNSGRTTNIPTSTQQYVQRGMSIYPNATITKRASAKKDSMDDTDDSNDPLIQQGKDLFKQITGQDVPADQPVEKKQTEIDVSDDPLVDEGKQLFQSITGKSVDSLDSQTQNNQKESVDQFTGEVNKPGVIQQALAGGKQGLMDVANTVGNTMENVSQWGDKNPLLASIDKFTGLYRTPEQVQQIQQKQQQDLNQYDQQYGNSVPAMAGRFAGNMLATAPLMGPIAKGGLAAGEAASGLVSPILQGTIRGAARVGVGAAQGAAGAALTGQDPTSGAVVGAMIPGAGNALQGASRLVSNTLQNGGLGAKMLQSKMADKLVDALGKGLGYHFGDFGGFFVGPAVGAVIKEITEKYGPVVAKRAADAIAKANEGALKAGVPGALGAENPFQTTRPF